MSDPVTELDAYTDEELEHADGKDMDRTSKLYRRRSP